MTIILHFRLQDDLQLDCVQSITLGAGGHYVQCFGNMSVLHRNVIGITIVQAN